MSKLMQLRRKMSNDGQDPYASKPGAELQFKNQTEKARQAEIRKLKEGKEIERKRKNKSSSSEKTETTEGMSELSSDKSDNEDLPDYKENGYHPIHIKYLIKILTPPPIVRSWIIGILS